MHIVTVENFLCCFKLEAGGYILGYLGAIFSFLAIALVVTLGVLVVVSFDNIDQLLTEQELENLRGSWELKMFLDSQILLIALLAVVTVYLVAYFCIYVLLISGTKNRNPDRLVPYLVMTVIGIVITLTQLATLNWQNVVGVVISVVWSVYLYICIYSLYVKFKNEKRYKFPEEA